MPKGPLSARDVLALLKIVARAVFSVWAMGRRVFPIQATSDIYRMNINQIFPEPRAAELAKVIASGDVARIRTLAAGVDLTYRGDKQVTFLQWALLNRRIDSLRALLDAGADPSLPGMGGDTVVHFAAKANDPAFLDALLAYGVDPNVPNAVTGAVPLAAAIMGNAESQFRALLKAGADPSRADNEGDTPLHVAGQIDQSARALDLLEVGADPAARNGQGVTFQRYLFMTRAAMLNAETLRARESVEAWLRARNIPIEGAR